MTVLTVTSISSAHAQRVLTQPQQVISVSKGASALLQNGTSIIRLTVGDPNVADALVVSPTEAVINGKALGSTTLLVWDNQTAPRIYSVEVTADAPALQRYIKALLPDENIAVSSSGNTVTLSGTVKDPFTAERAVELAKTSGATVIDNLYTPPAQQVMLKVRFAEIARSTTKDWSAAFSTLNPHKLSDKGDWSGTTNSDGQITFLLDNGTSDLAALITAAKSKGDFRSLAEPNLMTLPGQEAYFLAGGEFPFPMLQSATAGNAVTVQFRDFGIKLRFTPTIQRNGAIRLKLAPEVSSLDFANALVISGFEIPSILTRRAETNVELREGQWLAIAGLMDNNMTNNVTKIPILGDIPILGELFKSRGIRQRRTELLVLVSPVLVTASDSAAPVPTAEPSAWGLDGSLTKPIKR
ncbi:MAG TPA: pilus assembly protein N-terminal domain-containing protein [Gemmatimonadales bacterium]|nr:pilus assembly protein N-terminal domain-containing protein [Gemmatimonadales bacterium]